MQVRFHEFKNNIDVFELSSGRRQQDVFNFNNVRVSKNSKKFDFTKYSSGIRDMFENVVNFFYSDFFSSMGIKCWANYTIASFTYHLFYLVPISLPIFCEKIHIFRYL